MFLNECFDSFFLIWRNNCLCINNHHLVDVTALWKEYEVLHQFLFSDVYHWKCLDKKYRQLPSTTAPAGYKCLQCEESIFPLSNLATPVADHLRDKLATVNWARLALGLPAVSIYILFNVLFKNFNYIKFILLISGN